MEIVDRTRSLCPVCLSVIEADITKDAETVFLSKTCPTHGFFKTKHPWSRYRDYRGVKTALGMVPGADFADGLVINLNTACNMHCPFCFARANEYTMEEPTIGKISEVLSNFKGKYVYLCGGEPTLREDLCDLILSIKKKRYEIGLFTNGKRLVDLEYVSKLKRAGLDLVILQFDTLDDDQYKYLRGENLVSMKMRVVDNLKTVSIPVYLFVMLSKDINADQIGNLFLYVLEHQEVVKLINLNPVWDMGRVGSHKEMDASDILSELERQTELRFEDFIASTEFSYHFFEIIRKVTKRGGRMHPQCELRCYAIPVGNSLVPLSKIVDLYRLNEHLKKINSSLGTGRRVHNAVRLLLMLPYPLLVKYILKNTHFRKVVFKTIRGMVSKRSRFSSEVVSIIVGTFHTPANIDLDMVGTCNLFSEYESHVISSCLRQIRHLDDLARHKLATV